MAATEVPQRGFDSLILPPDTAGNLVELHHFLNDVETVGLLEAVASKSGRPCLSDIDKSEIGLQKNGFGHLDSCITFVAICHDEGRNSPLYHPVKSKLEEAQMIPHSPYSSVLTPEDIIGAVILYSAEKPIPFYKLINTPFNASGKRDPLSFKRQEHYIRLLILSQRLLMSIEELVYNGPVYRGLSVGNNSFMKDKFDNYTKAYKLGVIISLPAPTSSSFNEIKAKEFTHGIQFTFLDVQGLRLSMEKKLSLFDEDEIFLMGPLLFKVVACTKPEGTVIVICKPEPTLISYMANFNFASKAATQVI